MTASGRRAQGTPKGTQRGKDARAPKCPICGKPASRDYRPFCSKHCADIDLGRWLGGRYVVPGERVATNRDDDEED